MARRYRALHFGDMDGKNVVYHREHRSYRGRNGIKGMRKVAPRGSAKANSWKQRDYNEYTPIESRWKNQKHNQENG